MTYPSSPASLDPAILNIVRTRGIKDVVHFTTNHGLTGIAATGEILSRARLDENEHVPFVFAPNCANRFKDIDWLDYVNLSITTVSKRMLKTSHGWHREEDMWWLVLVLDSVILAHPGVQFVTTNNIYGATLRRASGPAGLEDMFAQRVPWGHHGSVSVRRPGQPLNQTTDPQAELLYPGAVSLEYVRAIYVPQAELADEVHMLMAVLPNFPSVRVEHRPEVFT